MRVRVASGAPEGHYATIAEGLRARAAARRGRVEVLSTQGSLDNVSRLAASPCDTDFALVQAGSPLTAPNGAPAQLTVVARLPKAESVFFLGKDADSLRGFASLRGLRVGIGPEGSGSAHLARALFSLPDLAGLGVKLETIDLAAALDRVAEPDPSRRTLDLAMMVIDEDAALVVSAVRERGLSLVDLPQADVVARRLPGLRTGRVGAGQFDAVRLLPPTDRKVLRVDTLVVASPCASRSEQVAMLSLLAEAYPELVRHNRDNPPPPELALAPVARDYFAHEGPELADEFVPWLVDVLAPAAWVTLLMVVSVLFNLLGVLHRFRLWRIDAARVAAEAELASLFWAGVTVGDLERVAPNGDQLGAPFLGRVQRLVADLESIAERCRAQSLSMVAPMGQEMVYRFQEELVFQRIAALRGLLERADDALSRARPASTGA